MSSAFCDWYNSYIRRSSSLPSYEEQRKLSSSLKIKSKETVIFNRKELKLKGQQLWDVQFGPSRFLNDHMCFEDQSLFWKWKNVSQLFSFWFFNNTLNVKLIKNSLITKIFHSIDLENLLQNDSIEELLNNPSSQF